MAYSEKSHAEPALGSSAAWAMDRRGVTSVSDHAASAMALATLHGLVCQPVCLRQAVHSGVIAHGTDGNTHGGWYKPVPRHTRTSRRRHRLRCLGPVDPNLYPLRVANYGDGWQRVGGARYLCSSIGGSSSAQTIWLSRSQSSSAASHRAADSGVVGGRIIGSSTSSAQTI